MSNIKSYKDTYKIEGRKYDRVTAILDYFTPKPLADKMRKDSSGMAEKSKTAKAVGTRVDTLIQELWRKGYCKFTEYDRVAVKNCIEAYKRWVEVEKPQILAMQETVWSDTLGIAGTLDCRLNGSIIDFKTSEAIYPGYWLQVAVYAHLKRNTGGSDISRIGILRMDKFSADDEYKVIEYDQRLVDCYIGLLNYYRYLQIMKKKPEVEPEWEVLHGEYSFATGEI